MQKVSKSDMHKTWIVFFIAHFVKMFKISFKLTLEWVDSYNYKQTQKIA